MKKEQLYEALGEIDEAYINEAEKSSNKAASKSMYLKWGSIAACFCLAVLVAVTVFYNDIFPKPKYDAEAEYAYILTYAGWSSDASLYENALNKNELIQTESTIHFPVFKVESIEELEDFKSAYKDSISFAQGYDTVKSFDEAMLQAQFDREIFYQEHSLIIVYIPANSGSLRFAVEEITTTDTSMCIHIEQTNDPEILTEDLAGWFVCIKADNDKISQITSFDAVWNKE